MTHRLNTEPRTPRPEFARQTVHTNQRGTGRDIDKVTAMPSKITEIDASAQPATLPPLSADFARQQAIKQEGNNYHSSSLRTMIPNSSVNKTNLHPGGVQYVQGPLVSDPLISVRKFGYSFSNLHRPQREHTDLEEELHELAHIDYDRVSIVSELLIPVLISSLK